jgi:hypothetical protein
MSQESQAAEEHEPLDPDPEAVAGQDDIDAEAEIDDPEDVDEVAEEERPHTTDDEGDLS